MFKTLMKSVVAASLVATPLIATAAEAQSRTTTIVQHRNGSLVKKTVVKTPVRANHRKWAKDQRFDRRYARDYRVVDYRNYRARRLYAPPRGYQWVRSGNDAVLVSIASGLIGAVLSGALR